MLIVVLGMTILTTIAAETFAPKVNLPKKLENRDMTH